MEERDLICCGPECGTQVEEKALRKNREECDSGPVNSTKSAGDPVDALDYRTLTILLGQRRSLALFVLRTTASAGTHDLH
jgi:hypothetical protein